MKAGKNALRERVRLELTRRELGIGILTGMAYLVMVALLFFNHVIAVFILLPYLYMHLKKVEKQIRQRRQEQICMQFKDGMLGISASLGAGYSVENAFREAVRELENLYGQDVVMVKEFRKIIRKIDCNENVETALEEMAAYLNLEEAAYFAEVFRYAKRSGGNLVDIIGKTATNISDKLSVREEIQVLISGKKMEQKVMNWMPFGIIAYLRLGAYEFVAPLYGNLFGVVVMSVCLVLYELAKMLSEKLVEIHV